MSKDMDFCLLIKTWAKNLSNKYGQKLTDIAKQSTTDSIKTSLKRAI